MAVCRTVDEAFQAGWDTPCNHGLPEPGNCPACRLTDSEIARLVVLLHGITAPVPARAAA